MRNKKQGFIPIILAVVLALVVVVGGVGVGLAWKTDVLDKILPPNVKEFFGRGPKTTDGEPTNGEQTNGEQPNGEEEPTNGEEPTPEDPIKDWKSYIDTKVGYRVKYPLSWFVYLRTGSGIVDNLDFTWFTSVDVSGQLDGGGAGAGSILSIPAGEAFVIVGVIGSDKKKTETLANWVRNNDISESEGSVTVRENAVFGGSSWTELTSPYRRTFYTAKGSFVYFFAIDLIAGGLNATNLELVELMVSTFEVL